MSRYRLRARSFEEALNLVINTFGNRSSKINMPVMESLGFVLAEDIVSDRDLPPYNMAFYDGYAVRSEDTIGASPSNPVKLKLAGLIFNEDEYEKIKIKRGFAAYVSANAPVPEGADAVVRVEFTERMDNTVLIKRAVESNQDIIMRGEDVRRGDLIIEEGRIIRPQDISLMLEIGKYRVRVYRKPRVVIIAVGNELIERMDKGIIYPDNYSIYIAKSLELLGVDAYHFGIISDDPSEIKRVVLENIHKYDMMMLIGGASIGLNDHTGRSLEEIGEIVFHGTNLSPGKVSGLVKVKGRPVFLVPGHIGSAISCLYNFVYPLISKVYFNSAITLPTVYAELTENVDLKRGSYTFRTVTLKWENGKLYATPHLKRLGGSTLLTVFIKAQGYILIPPGEKVKKGDTVKVTLFSNIEQILSS